MVTLFRSVVVYPQPATKTHTAARTLPRSGKGERFGRVKVRKLTGSDKDSLTRKAKATHATKAKQGIHSLLPISRQGFSHLWESRAPSCRRVTWEDKRRHSECLPPSFFCSPFYMLRMTSCGTDYPFAQLGSAVPAMPPPNFLCPPSLHAGRAR